MKKQPVSSSRKSAKHEPRPALQYAHMPARPGGSVQIGWRCGPKGFRVLVTLHANDASEPTVKEFDPREFLEVTGLKFFYQLKPDLKQILRREDAKKSRRA